MKIQGYHHTSLLITDLKQAAYFYENIIGLKRIERPNLNFEGLWYAVGDLQLHLLKLSNPLRQQKPPEHVGRDWHLALAVDEIDSLKQRLIAEKITYTMSRSGRVALFCRDFDDNGLEFVGNHNNSL